MPAGSCSWWPVSSSETVWWQTGQEGLCLSFLDCPVWSFFPLVLSSGAVLTLQTDFCGRSAWTELSLGRGWCCLLSGNWFSHASLHSPRECRELSSATVGVPAPHRAHRSWPIPDFLAAVTSAASSHDSCCFRHTCSSGACSFPKGNWLPSTGRFPWEASPTSSHSLWG